ncbi:Cys-tRNA(Pro) deacylase [Paramicrobacterium sp. CJ85]|uniref:Cys-tRNA(Pro) deacylase n=1 Tax=Paramicrobacterium sp. CJ85 TaxID=3445355 RepID=UPI003F63895E
MAKRSSGSEGTPATRALAAARVPFAVRRYTHNPAVTDFGAEAARELAVDPECIFKTLIAVVDEELIVAIVPVTRMVQLKSLAKASGGKRARLADPALAERRTGYVVGGISPIGQKTMLQTVLDSSALEHPQILVSGGRRGLDIELDPRDLVVLTGAVTAPIAV